MECEAALRTLSQGRCGLCGASLEGRLHIRGLARVAEWEYPTIASLPHPGISYRAIALICERCCSRRDEPTEAVELNGEGEIRYHRVADLVPWFPGPLGTA